MKKVHVVLYKDKYYVWYHCDHTTLKCKLLDADGNKYSGTPHADKLTLVKERTLERVEFNHHTYFKTKIGVFSATTGNRINADQILSLFK